MPQTVWAAAQLAWNSYAFEAVGTAGQELHSMWHWEPQGRRWGRLDGPAGGTWVEMHRGSDVEVEDAVVEGTLLGLHKPESASAEVVHKPWRSGQAGEAKQLCQQRRCACKDVTRASVPQFLAVTAP